MRKQYLIFSLLAVFVLLVAFVPEKAKYDRYHSRAELSLFQEMIVNPPVDTNLYFGTSSHCYGCHSRDPLEFGLVDEAGNDVAMFEDWATTMMANSAKDPFWRAKVSHESISIPAYADEIQDKCTSCHAPMGHYTAAYHGELPYTMEDLLADTLGLDGVSCSSCHMISEENLGQQFSGEITFDTLDRFLYGPYQIPYAAPMQIYVGFEPVYSEHILDAGVCASCHTLITSSFDLDGNPTGETFVEQATYHEWLNSDYGEDADNVTCQGCHMAPLDDSVIISANYNFLEKRFPYGPHELVGGNTFMLQLMKENRFELGLWTGVSDWDQTIDKTYAMLQERSLSSSLEMVANQGDTAYFELYLENQAGHKFPSGYPSRRAFVEFVVETAAGDTLFHSGAYDQDYNLYANDPEFETHFDVINSPDQVQIYEFVQGDINGDFTTVLEHAYAPLKDNRLPPKGFRKDHFTYDTVQVVGAADLDPNFNYEGQEGSGSDRITFAVSLNGYDGDVHVNSRVYYQSLPLRWLAPMLAEETPEINTFRSMFNEADHTPVLITEDLLENVYVEGEALSAKEAFDLIALEVSPNPSWSGRFSIQPANGQSIEKIQVWDVSGRLVRFHQTAPNEIWIGGKGVFVIRVQTAEGWGQKRVVIQ
ncbi:MAG: T9SS type A sorting domain-containing protein [Bacteroidetes bacterium]|nr:T9SS type A sorting domain-containing protein [Bacteroidota bacterium]